MSKYLEFDNPKYPEFGYKEISKSRDSIKENIGKKCVYICNRDVDRHRGRVFPQFGVVSGLRYSRLFTSENYGSEIDIRDLIDIGIKDE